MCLVKIILEKSSGENFSEEKKIDIANNTHFEYVIKILRNRLVEYISKLMDTLIWYISTTMLQTNVASSNLFM